MPKRKQKKGQAPKMSFSQIVENATAQKVDDVIDVPSETLYLHTFAEDGKSLIAVYDEAGEPVTIYAQDVTRNLKQVLNTDSQGVKAVKKATSADVRTLTGIAEGRTPLSNVGSLINTIQAALTSIGIDFKPTKAPNKNANREVSLA